MTYQELHRLIDDYGSASFDCGEYQGDNYEVVYAKCDAARMSLLDAVRHLYYGISSCVHGTALSSKCPKCERQSWRAQ